jgi:hypothetical protein
LSPGGKRTSENIVSKITYNKYFSNNQLKINNLSFKRIFRLVIFVIMTVEQFAKAVNALKNISIDFRIDYFMLKSASRVRGIFLNNSEDVSKVKSLLDADILKGFRFMKSKAWYLGDEKEVIFMQLKKFIPINVRELEDFQVSNYA